MIILKNNEKLFSDRSSEITQIIKSGHTYVKEIMKSIELYWDDPRDVSHWIDKAGGYIFNDTVNKTYVKLQYCFINSLSDNETVSLVGNDYLVKIRSMYINPENFIQEVKKEILTEDGGKYKTWIKSYSDFKVSNKEYVSILKYMSLCFSGLICPDEWYENKWKSLSIPKSSKINITNVNQLKDLIHSCIKYILGVGEY